MAGRSLLTSVSSFREVKGQKPKWSKLKSEIVLRSTIFSILVDSYAFKWETCASHWAVMLRMKTWHREGTTDGRSPRSDMKRWTGSNKHGNYTDQGKVLFLGWEECSLRDLPWLSLYGHSLGTLLESQPHREAAASFSRLPALHTTASSFSLSEYLKDKLFVNVPHQIALLHGLGSLTCRQ